jgi:outer membrane receptor protein involved in Fe transport
MIRSTIFRVDRRATARRLVRHLAVPTFITLGAAVSLDAAVAQTASPAPAAAGRVEGQTKDALNRPLAGVKLHLEAPDGKVAGRATSDAGGRFAFTGVAPGLYSLVGERADFQTSTALVTVQAAAGARADLVLASNTALDLKVQAQRLNEARANIAPSLGATVYQMDQGALQSQAQGDNAPFNQTLLRAPGIAEDSFGQLHVRGDHANLQYRINGVLIPEGITGFGQVFDTRFADSVSLITGALPAQYGYRTAGIIDIQTKTGDIGTGGEVGMYGGSYGTLNPSGEAYGSDGPINWYFTGNYLQNQIGIESPTGTPNPIHDDSIQGKGFGMVNWLVNPDTRVSFIGGSSYGFFHIPDNPNQAPMFTPYGQTAFNSANLNEKQRELNDYGALSFQQSLDKLDYQVTAFGRYSSVFFKPDILGDLAFNGDASRIYRNVATFGLQDDNSYKLNEDHTLRQGVIVSSEYGTNKNSSQVFALDPTTGLPTSDIPETIGDDSSRWGYQAGIYLQDEWKLTDKLTLNYGARFDYYTAYVTDEQVSPRINAVYKLTDRTTLHAGYAREFTPPPFELVNTESVAKFLNTSLETTGTTQDSPVKVQKDNYYDVGATHKLTDNLQVGIDGYYKQVQDLIDEGQFGTALIFTPFNYKVGKIYGVELTSNYKYENFTLYGNFAYSVALGKDIESAQFNFDPAELAYIASNFVHLDHDQTYTGSVGATYKIPDTDTLLTTDTTVGSGLRRGFANTESQAAYAATNVGIVQKLEAGSFGDLTARFDVLNILDQKYELRDGTGIGVGAPQFGERRAFFAGLSKKF